MLTLLGVCHETVNFFWPLKRIEYRGTEMLTFDKARTVVMLLASVSCI